MSLKPPRRPSTLSADRHTAASRPIGWAPDPRATARPSSPPFSHGASASAPAAPAVPTAALRSGTAGTPRSSVVAATRGKIAARQTTSSRKDYQIVSSSVVALVLMLVAVASIRMNGDRQLSQSKDAIGNTLKGVHSRQSEFRVINRRFATWNELEARGVRLPQWQRLVASNATASHWFVSLSDTQTGVVCSRTGELFDEGPDDRTPVCREAGP